MFPHYAQIEWITPKWMYFFFRIRVGIIRVWPITSEPGIENKDPYSWACTVEHKSRGVLEFKGVDKSPSPYEFRQIVRELKRHGYVTGTWTRMGEDRIPRTVNFPSPK